MSNSTQATQPRSFITLICSSSKAQAVHQLKRLASKHPSNALDPIRKTFFNQTKNVMLPMQVIYTQLSSLVKKISTDNWHRQNK